MKKGKKRSKKSTGKKKSSRSSNTLVGSLIIIFFLAIGLGLLVQQVKIFSEIPQKPILAKARNVRILPSPTPTFFQNSLVKTIQAQNQNTGYCLDVPVLMYHHIQPEAQARQKGQTPFTVDSVIFDQQMNYLASNGYTPIFANQLIDALRNKALLPPKSIVLTFDDGYKDIYNYAFPVFKKYNLKANLMIPTGLMEGKDYLTWSQIEEMGKSGLISFANHTWSHFNLPKGPEEKIKFEISTAKQDLEQRTGQKIDLIAYPYGAFDNTVIRIVQENGFIGGLSTIPGITQCDSFIMSLHRSRIGNTSLVSYGL